METSSIRPSIRHWLRHKGALRTVAWVTPAGETQSITGRIAGWRRAETGTGQYLVVEVPGGRGPARHVRKLIGAKALQRHLDATDQARPARSAPERCQECGKVLGTGAGGHLDDHAAVVGFCFDCA